MSEDGGSDTDDQTSSSNHLLSHEFLAAGAGSRTSDGLTSDCSTYIAEDFKTVPEKLRNIGNGRRFRFPIEPFSDENNLVRTVLSIFYIYITFFKFISCLQQLTPNPDSVVTMDGVHKCLTTLPNTPLSLYTKPNEGFTWAFMGRCVGASIPEHIDKALYFFYRLMADIESTCMTRYVIPTHNLELKYDREVIFVVLLL